MFDCIKVHSVKEGICSKAMESSVWNLQVVGWKSEWNLQIAGWNYFVYSSTGCPKKNYTLFWRAIAPLNFELGIKVGGVLEFSGSQL